MPAFQKWSSKANRQSAVWNLTEVPGLYVAKHHGRWFAGYHSFHPTPQAAWITRQLQNQFFDTRQQAAQVAVMLYAMYAPTDSIHPDPRQAKL